MSVAMSAATSRADSCSVTAIATAHAVDDVVVAFQAEVFVLLVLFLLRQLMKA